MSSKDVALRSPIIVVVGHVDVGKTLLLDKIRNTFVAYREPGMITQHIGLSYIPWSAVERFTGGLLERFRLKGKIWIDGFLVVDTPGHAVFSNLRRRGGSVADVAVLVIDVLKGFEEQTYECLTLIRSRNIPFVVAANKIDKIYGWRPIENAPFIESIQRQSEIVQGRLEELLSNIISEFEKLGYEADRYDRITDWARQIPIVPTSAVTGEGVADLLVTLAGVAQRFVKDKLKVSLGPGRGVVMDVREERGWGATIDVVLYDGVIRRGDTIVTMGFEGPIVTKVKMIVMPKPLDEMRDPEDKYMFVDSVRAAAGIKIIADNLKNVIPGSTVLVVDDESKVEDYKKLVEEEVKEIKIEVDREGIVAKADTLGTLEVLVQCLRSQSIPIRIADVGQVSRRDVVEALISKRRNPLYGVIVAFNTKVPRDVEIEASQHGIKIFRGEIVYRIIEDLTKWFIEERQLLIQRELDKYIRPAKIKILEGCVFRRSNPAIVGIRVLEGVVKPGYPLVRADGRRVGRVAQIQDKGKSISKAMKGMEVAISIEGHVIVGRHVKEGDVLYVDVPDDHAVKLLTEYRQYISDDEVELLKEFIRLKRGWRVGKQ